MSLKESLLALYNWCIYSWWKLFNTVTSHKIVASMGDLIFGMGFDTKMQNLTVSRLLDIENYYDQSDDLFYFAKAFSSKNPSFDSELCVSNFIKLLHSVESNGYNQKYTPIIDSHGRLWNGTHRVAVCLFYKIFDVNIKVLKRESPMNNVFSLETTSLTLSDYEKIRLRYNSILLELVDKGSTYCCIGEKIEDIKTALFDEFADDIILLAVHEFYEGGINTQKKSFVQFYLKHPTYLFSNRSFFVNELLNLKNKHTELICSLNCAQGQLWYNHFKEYFV